MYTVDVCNHTLQSNCVIHEVSYEAEHTRK